MSSSNQLDTTTIVLLVLGALIVLPMLTMGLGFGMMGAGGMMGGYGGTGGLWPLVGMLVPLAVLLALLGGGVVLVRRVNESETGHDPALAELRSAYARGDITDDEYETRREKLERSN